jgi:hypothetical protein
MKKENEHIRYADNLKIDLNKGHQQNGTQDSCLLLEENTKTSFSLFFKGTTRQHIGIYGFDVGGHDS